MERFKLIPAVYVLLRRDNDVLLSRRANTGYQDGKYGLVAGHMDGNELATHALVREASEEVGIIINPENLQFVHVIHRLNRNQIGQERVDFFFECTEWEGEPTNIEPEKCDELLWAPLNDLPTDTLPLIKLVIADIQDGISYSEYTTEPL